MHSSGFSAFFLDILYTVRQRQKQHVYEIRSLAICINIKAFNRINTKQLNILETYLEYLEFDIVTY